MGQSYCPARLWYYGNVINVHMTARIIRRLKNRVYLAHFGPRGKGPTQIVAIKIARGLQELNPIEREFNLYENDLKNLQGSVVPGLLGFFRGSIDGIDIACLLLEFCSGPENRDHIELKYVE